jgi:hypothetical protein
MDCQLGCPLKSVTFTYFPGAHLDLGMPCLGQCLNVGIDGRTHAAINLESTKNALTCN